MRRFRGRKLWSMDNSFKKDHWANSVYRRMQKPVDARKDFFSTVLAEEEGKELSADALAVQSALFMYGPLSSIRMRVNAFQYGRFRNDRYFSLCCHLLPLPDPRRI